MNEKALKRGVSRRLRFVILLCRWGKYGLMDLAFWGG